jgi:hypothetical protein
MHRVVSLRGTVNDYIACVLALGLILLVPAFSVAGTLNGEQQLLHERISTVNNEADLWTELEKAHSRRGNARMNATVAGHVWDDLVQSQH